MDELSRVRVLVVDDHAGLRRSTARLLEALGAEVCTADDLASAVPQATAIDVALVDVRLKDQHGGDVVTALRERRSSLAVVAMSGKEHRPTWLAPRDVFLPKPFDVGQLAEAVKRALATS